MSRDLHGAEIVALAHALHFTHRGVRILQRHVRRAGEAVRLLRNNLRDAVVLLHCIGGEIDPAGEDLHIDALPVHGGEPLVDMREEAGQGADVVRAGELHERLLFRA